MYSVVTKCIATHIEKIYSFCQFQINVELFNENFETCLITNLDNPGLDDFNRDHLDQFRGSVLEQCENFVVPNHNVALLQVQHFGADGWKPEYFRIFFDDGFYVECPTDELIDDQQVVQIECRVPFTPC